MIHRLPLLACCAALGALAASPAAQARTLDHDVLSRLAKATRLGPAPATDAMSVGVALVRPHRAAEERLVAALSDPSSASYHHFLSPRQFARRFGVPAAQAAATRAWVRSAGLQVRLTSRAHDFVYATGTVAQVQRLTHTTVGRYRFGTTTFLANDAAPTVPGTLPIGTIMGLNTWERHHTALAEGRALGLGEKSSAIGPDDVLSPRTAEQLWSIYEQPAADTGQGQSIAILGNGATDSVIKDLHQFDREHHFPEVPVDVRHIPASGDFSDTSGNGEWQIDMQATDGMAPGIDKEVLYFSPTLADTDLVAATKAWVDDPTGPKVMNASLGECEVTPLNDRLNDQSLYDVNGNENPAALPVSQGLSNSSEPEQTATLRQAVLEGRTLFAASGDAGSSCTVLYPGTNGIGNYGVPLTEDPADSPYAVGVGGTVLYSDGNTPAGRGLEYAWTHSGGNASPFESMPAFQQSLSFPLERPCLLNSDTGQPGGRCRAVPDVAALSGDVLTNGYEIVGDGADTEGGGTSLSSPLWAGMWARVAASAPAGSPGYGFADEAIYKVAADPGLYGQSFYDVIQGSNGLNPAVPGYDYVTGLGTPKLTGLISAIERVAPAPAPAAGAATGSGASTTGGGAAAHPQPAPHRKAQHRKAGHRRHAKAERHHARTKRARHRR